MQYKYFPRIFIVFKIKEEAKHINFLIKTLVFNLNNKKNKLRTQFKICYILHYEHAENCIFVVFYNFHQINTFRKFFSVFEIFGKNFSNFAIISSKRKIKKRLICKKLWKTRRILYFLIWSFFTNFCTFFETAKLPKFGDKKGKINLKTLKIKKSNSWQKWKK